MAPSFPADAAARAAAALARFDGRGGDTLHVRCAGFAAGTPVATTLGARAVEAIGPGDAVLLAGGATARVLWRRARRSDALALARNPQRRPVLVAAGALGPGLPERDVLLAPDQGIAGPEGAVPAAWAVDGAAVRRIAVTDGITYVTLGLDGQGALLAAGMACPSTTTAEAHAAAALRRQLAGAPGPLQGLIEQVRNGVIEGWALDAGRPDSPVVLELAADGVAIAWTVAERRRPDLEMQGLGGGACAFELRFDRPSGARVLTLRDVEGGTDLAGSPLMQLPPAAGPGLAAALQAAPGPSEAASLIFTLADDIAFAAGIAARGPRLERPHE